MPGQPTPLSIDKAARLMVDAVSLSPAKSLVALLELLATKGLIAGDLRDRDGGRDG